ncbi:retrovirus-related pol polyprotein from transposon TNT 1-94, partial [Tanacetum coccineum]
MKGKSVETKFEKPSVIRQPDAFKSQRQSALGKPASFSDSLAKKDFSKSKSVTTNNVSNDFSNLVTAQILPQNVKSILKNTNVIAPGMYKVHTKPNQTRTPQLPQDIRKTNKRMSFSTGVIPTTIVSRPQLKSNQLEDSVMHNNSQGKKQQVKDHRRNFKFSKTKQPIIVPISTREHKRTVNQFVATPLKKTVAAESTNPKPRNKIRKQFEHVSKTCKWWCSTVSNTPLSSNTFAARRDNSIHHRLWVLKAHDGKSQAPNCFRKSICYIRDLKGNDLLIGSRGTYLYPITLQDTSTPNLICLMAKASSSQAWLWHRHLSHLNFDTINLLSKYDIVTGLPKLKFVKDHLCFS